MTFKEMDEYEAICIGYNAEDEAIYGDEGRENAEDAIKESARLISGPCAPAFEMRD